MKHVYSQNNTSSYRASGDIPSPQKEKEGFVHHNAQSLSSFEDNSSLKEGIRLIIIGIILMFMARI